MIRLSKKGWNNVLIFSMLIMIFLFNGLHLKLLDAEVDDVIQPILNEQSYILTIEYPSYKIERIGTGWRSSAELTQIQITELINNWKQAKALRIADTSSLKAEAKTKSADQIVMIWLAGEALPQVFAFFKLADAYYIHMPKSADDIWLKLDTEQYQLLFPEVSGNN